jgi:hypothetical protein
VGDVAGKVAEDVEPRRCEGKHLDVRQPIAPTQAGRGGSVSQLPRVWLPTLLYRAGALLQTVPLPDPLPISLLWQAPSLQQCSRTSRPRQVSGPPPQPLTLTAQRCVWTRRPTISCRPCRLPRRRAAGEREGQQPAAQQVCWPPPQQQVPASAGCWPAGGGGQAPLPLTAPRQGWQGAPPAPRLVRCLPAAACLPAPTKRAAARPPALLCPCLHGCCDGRRENLTHQHRLPDCPVACCVPCLLAGITAVS